MDSKKKRGLLLSMIKLIDQLELKEANKNSLLNSITWKLVNECNSQSDPQKAHTELLDALKKKNVFERVESHLEEVSRSVENGWERQLLNVSNLVKSLQ